MYSCKNGTTVTEIGFSHDLMAVACLVPASAPVQGHKMPYCCGSILISGTQLLGKKEFFCYITSVSSAPFSYFCPPYSNFGIADISLWICISIREQSSIWSQLNLQNLHLYTPLSLTEKPHLTWDKALPHHPAIHYNGSKVCRTLTHLKLCSMSGVCCTVIAMAQTECFTVGDSILYFSCKL